MSKQIRTEATDLLFDAILSLKDKAECYTFFEDICTINELMSLSQRFEVAKMLREQKTYLEIAEKTYVNVNIHKKENEDKLKQLAQLPDSCAASADCLEKQRAIFEQYHVFSPAMVDGIISKLRSYEDRTLRSEVHDNQEEMLKLVNKYFHCG